MTWLATTRTWQARMPETGWKEEPTFVNLSHVRRIAPAIGGRSKILWSTPGLDAMIVNVPYERLIQQIQDL